QLPLQPSGPSLHTANRKHKGRTQNEGSSAAQEKGTMSVPGCAYKLLLSCPAGLSRSQVYVDFAASYDRISHPDGNLEKSIAEYGDSILKSRDDVSRGNCVCLKLGLTDYRTFVGTNLNPLWENFLVPSEETSDKKILVLQRSSNVGEFPGYFVFPGGHSEPKEVGISAHTTDEPLTDLVLLNQKVAEEMFDGIIREVVEEIGVPVSSLAVLMLTSLQANVQTHPVFIGISLRELNVRPTAFFFLKCNLESEEVHKLYSSAQDGYESTQLYAMSKSDIDSVTLKIPGCHRGGYALYNLMTASGDA
ncbi:hypothetical protein Taro_045265, partial [Colocasia esculenta]|nr:hypothetical protein [Colocasia esculenta]